LRDNTGHPSHAQTSALAGKISDALELGQAFLLIFLQYLVFFCSKTRNMVKKGVFLKRSCEFLVNKKLRDMLLQQLEKCILVGIQLLVALIV
jgi:hypothetical protein